MGAWVPRDQLVNTFVRTLSNRQVGAHDLSCGVSVNPFEAIKGASRPITLVVRAGGGIAMVGLQLRS